MQKRKDRHIREKEREQEQPPGSAWVELGGGEKRGTRGAGLASASISQPHFSSTLSTLQSQGHLTEQAGLPCQGPFSHGSWGWASSTGNAHLAWMLSGLCHLG